MNRAHQIRRLSIIGAVLALSAALAADARAQTRTQGDTSAPASPAPPILTPAQLDSAARDGAALGAKQGGWFGRAYAVGFLANLIGTAIIIPVAASSEPKPPANVRQQLLARGPAYQAAFENSFTRTVRRKRVRTSIAGALLGTATIFVLFNDR